MLSKLNKFRSLSPNEYIEEGTLIWMERNSNVNNAPIFTGPYILESGWGPVWFGSPNENKPESKSRVKLIDTINGDINVVTWRSFLFTTYYIIDGDKNV